MEIIHNLPTVWIRKNKPHPLVPESSWWILRLELYKWFLRFLPKRLLSLLHHRKYEYQKWFWCNMLTTATTASYSSTLPSHVSSNKRPCMKLDVLFFPPDNLSEDLLMLKNETVEWFYVLIWFQPIWLTKDPIRKSNKVTPRLYVGRMMMQSHLLSSLWPFHLSQRWWKIYLLYWILNFFLKLLECDVEKMAIETAGSHKTSHLLCHGFVLLT